MTRALYLVCGIFFTALGIVGAFMPILPTVPFLLLAIFFFARSRPEWADKLYAHPRYGPPLLRWRDQRAISRKAKISSLMVMALSAAASWLTAGWPWAAVASLILLCSGTWIWTRAE